MLSTFLQIHLSIFWTSGSQAHCTFAARISPGEKTAWCPTCLRKTPRTGSPIPRKLHLQFCISFLLLRLLPSEFHMIFVAMFFFLLPLAIQDALTTLHPLVTITIHTPCVPLWVKPPNLMVPCVLGTRPVQRPWRDLNAGAAGATAHGSG